MSPREAPRSEPAPAPAGDQGNVRLSGRRLLLARAITLGLAAGGLGVFLATIPARFHQLQTLAAGRDLDPTRMGLSDAFVGWYVVALDVAVVATCCALGAVLLARRPDERMALFVALMLVLYAIFVVRPADALVGLPPVLALASNAVRALGQVCLLFFTYIFPDGRSVPRWTGWLGLTWAGLTLLWLLFPAVPFNPIHLGNPPRMAPSTLLVFTLWLGTGLGAQVYRYVRVSSWRQRQQTKGVVLAAAGALVGFAIFQVPGSLLPVLQQPGAPRLVYVLVGVPVLYTAALLIPVAIGLAILRHHLYDIDLVVHRTLVYSSLTLILGTTYFGSVVALQAAISALTHQADQPLAIALSTLLIAALVQPLRRRLQRAIDRRFYRRRYAAAKTLAAFGATMRSEMDLTALCERLLAVVDETMRPEQVSLWLRPTRLPDVGASPGPRLDG